MKETETRKGSDTATVREIYRGSKEGDCHIVCMCVRAIEQQMSDNDCFIS